MSEIHKLIAVYGNSGSYKTSTAVGLVKAIAALDGSAEVVLVGLDGTKPLIPLLFPTEKKKSTASLGRMLSMEYFDRDSILQNVVMSGNIGVIGYNTGENYNSYATPLDGRMDDFFMQMRHLVNYTVIDCTSDVISNKMTAKALINAEDVVHLISCDINGLVFALSQEAILQNDQYGYNRFTRLLSITDRIITDISAMENALSPVAGYIPYSSKAARAFNDGQAFENFHDSAYNRTIKELALSLIGGDD
jgi:hypothetical protein